VHDVLAHLAAIPTDALAGRLTGIPTDEFTAEQVRERKSATTAQLLDEWSGNVAAMVDLARTGLIPANLAVDALTHEQDIRGALGLSPALNAEELRFCVGLFAFTYGYGLKQAGIGPLRMKATDSDFDFVAGVGEPVASVRAPEFELFRALPGRRGRTQVAGWDWQGDAATYVDRFSIFGPLPEAALTG
jgi:uncharacterized protein (TIGR03083 family)